MSASERRQVRSLVPDLLDLFEAPFGAWQRPFMPAIAAQAQAIRIEDYTDGGNYVVRAELPGIDPAKDVEITATGDVLRIHAERHEEHKDAHRSEFRYGAFTRTLPLPRGTTTDDIKASYDQGVLTVMVPMPEVKEATKRVTIETKKKTKELKK
jgi:HSP20 family molecular chaperone IbpA